MESTEIPLEPMDDPEMFTPRHRRRCCCCIWVSWPAARSPASSSSETWQRIHAGAGGGDERRWWTPVVGALMKVREWSELVAGPRWKTFIRRFNRSRSGGGGWGRMGSARFQYDPLSYALNFDEGHGASPEGEHTGYRDFSARFAAPPVSAKSSMDLGGRDAPPIFAAPSDAGL